MIFLIILIILLVLITILLLTPIRFKIDSNKNIYLAEWKHLISAKVLLQNDEPIVQVKSFFWRKEFNLLKIKSSPSKTTQKKKKVSKQNKSKFNFRNKIKPLLKSFQVRKFFINIDTNDYVWNAYLFPVFHFLKNEKRQLHINFQGNVEVLLDIQNRPIRILWVLIF